MTRKRARLGLGLLVASCGIAVAIATSAPAHATLTGRGTGVGAGPGAHGDDAFAQREHAGTSFSISGSSDGLYPGLTKPLKLTVTNPQHFPIVVTSLTVTVQDARPGCSAGNVAVTPLSGKLPVAARSTATATVSITLLHTAPDACQSAAFPLRYTATAVKP